MDRKKYKIHAGSYVLELGLETKIMGVINMTPDSFSKDGLAGSLSKAQRLAATMIRDGAHILDIGGESSRPGSRSVSVKEERERVIPLVKALAKKYKTPISVDTYKLQIVKEALDAGASIINTIKGVNPDKSLLKMIRAYKAAVVLMHMRGTPQTMQKKIFYKDVVKEIIGELQGALRQCLDAGIDRKHIIIDPGIGFGKTVEHNLEILNRLDEFGRLKQPILIGASRKSFIGHILNQPVEHRLAGSLAAACLAVSRGAHIIRAHDVKETGEALKTADMILNSDF